ncbi:2'-5' RNA ligase [Syntrophotalea acetylenivorans]|uniref:RNA 2',3'-cyclic phosphodiesterase n=1 Tax=Syntrophotalea acetylenivorans TaxID=1842532 RepID=A0A1L3GSE2_9BACT|nr:RNA 2',3'-cyclic phosphodiesterase [Syntrophotalea acetylenivorans]APG28815.1 2'-5' RNA ligase [Syntrophotalea acetylenivorans]
MPALTKVRAFVAMPLPEASLRIIGKLQQELAKDLPGVRWVKPETIHLTLAFLGDIAEDSLERLGSSMLSIGDLQPPVTATFSGVGAFPSRSRPRVVWLGIDGGRTLTQIHEALATELRTLQLPVDDRPFVPHLTLGRSRKSHPGAGRILESFSDRDCGSAQLDQLVLYESRLGPRGALHLPRHRVSLTGVQP